MAFVENHHLFVKHLFSSTKTHFVAHKNKNTNKSTHTQFGSLHFHWEYFLMMPRSGIMWRNTMMQSNKLHGSLLDELVGLVLPHVAADGPLEIYILQEREADLGMLGRSISLSPTGGARNTPSNVLVELWRASSHKDVVKRKRSRVTSDELSVRPHRPLGGRRDLHFCTS